MLLDDEVWLSKFRIVVIDENTLKRNQSQNGWSRLGLNYKVDWPFYSLITQKVIKKLERLEFLMHRRTLCLYILTNNRYNEIFNYLLSIRRVQIELNQCFLIQMRTSSKENQFKKINPTIWLTRNHMSFLIDNLQFYLQVSI